VFRSGLPAPLSAGPKLMIEAVSGRSRRRRGPSAAASVTVEGVAVGSWHRTPGGASAAVALPVALVGEAQGGGAERCRRPVFTMPDVDRCRRRWCRAGLENQGGVRPPRR